VVSARISRLCSGRWLRTVGSIMKMNPVPVSNPLASAKRFVREDVGMAPIQWVLSLLSALVWLAMCFLAADSVRAQTAAPTQAPEGGILQTYVQELVRQQPLPQGDAPTTGGKLPWRVEVVMGQLDPRLKLAPCDKVKAYMPDGMQMWGKTRVGLRCEQGPVRWNIYWPITVKVWGQALVASSFLRSGALIADADLKVAEVDMASHPSPALIRSADAVGRYAARNIEPGQSLRQDDIKVKRWFAAGDTVHLTVRGAGFAATSEGMALTHGDEGRCARVRTDNGQVVCAQPVGDKAAEVTL
jgi:flagella basal body P-ring formation protein FlgA